MKDFPVRGQHIQSSCAVGQRHEFTLTKVELDKFCTQNLLIPDVCVTESQVQVLSLMTICWQTQVCGGGKT